jgi:hypothetical protein
VSGDRDRLSVKAQRVLTQLGVLDALRRGESLVLAGCTYARRKQPEGRVRLAFQRDDEGRLCVGYASDESGSWQSVDAEPFSMRALGYYRRWLKRVGDVCDDADRSVR